MRKQILAQIPQCFDDRSDQCHTVQMTTHREQHNEDGKNESGRVDGLDIQRLFYPLGQLNHVKIRHRTFRFADDDVINQHPSDDNLHDDREITGDQDQYQADEQHQTVGIEPVYQPAQQLQVKYRARELRIERRVISRSATGR